MGFFNKMIFWKRRRGNVSPAMVDASVSTEGPSKCDVETMTANMVGGGENVSYEAPPAPYKGWRNRCICTNNSHMSLQIGALIMHAAHFLHTLKHGPTAHPLALYRDVPSTSVPKWPFSGPPIYHKRSHFCVECFNITF